ncbi:MAG: hypothetical protein ACYCOS_03595 [Sulfobacillus sp.]
MPTDYRVGMSGPETPAGSVVGRRTEHRQPGFGGYDEFVELAKALRGADLICPRGVYRFTSFEEADK